MHTQYHSFKAKLAELVDEIVLHGHGDMKIHITIPKEDKRSIVIEAGKSYRYTIPLSEVRD